MEKTGDRRLVGSASPPYYIKDSTNDTSIKVPAQVKVILSSPSSSPFWVPKSLAWPPMPPSPSPFAECRRTAATSNIAETIWIKSKKPFTGSRVYHRTLFCQVQTAVSFIYGRSLRRNVPVIAYSGVPVPFKPDRVDHIILLVA